MTKNILVMSNKGGVGKTTIAVNLATVLSKDYKVGLMDVDIHGPNVPKMLGLKDKRPKILNGKVIPIKINNNLCVMSIAFLTENQNDPIIWRGPLKTKLIQQFIDDVKWPKLDYLIVDLPPGTGDETITIMQLLKDSSSSIIVSTPQEVSILDAKKAINTSREFGIPIIGLIENMSGQIFGSGRVERFAKDNKIKFLGRLELDKTIADSSNKGKPFVMNKNTKSSHQFNEIVKEIIEIQ